MANPTTEIKTVTPKMCATWLNKNEGNRPLKQAAIDKLARTMARGDWVLNGEALKFDTAGNVLDGQHRMTACVQSKTSFKTLVIRKLPRETFDTLDTGTIRTANDILAINNEKNVTILTGALRHVMRYQSCSIHNTNAMTNREIEEGLEINPDIREYVHWTASNRVRWLSSGIIAAAYYLAALQNTDKADAFFEGLVSGANLSSDSPILVIRNKFIDVQASPIQRLTPVQRMELLILAWNLWIKGKTQQRFNVGSFSKKSKDFPQFKAS